MGVAGVTSAEERGGALGACRFNGLPDRWATSAQPPRWALPTALPTPLFGEPRDQRPEAGGLEENAGWLGGQRVGDIWEGLGEG